jgi:hypothetical protein
MYVGTAAALLVFGAWVWAGQPVAAGAFGQGYLLGVVVVAVAVAAERARRSR